MKKKTHLLLFMAVCFCLPLALPAQERDDSKYLNGAVPEADGKVIFTKEFSIPGMSQDEIHKRMSNWMDARLKQNENISRVVLSDKEDGQVVGVGDEWIVFSSTALSLDRTKISYQLTALCQPEKCTLKMEKIRFSYREGKEKYTAEEWITDKYALNKAHTKLIRGLAKWRKKTVDFADALASEAAEALSAATTDVAEAKKQEETKGKEPVTQSGPIVINPKNVVVPVTETDTPASADTQAAPPETAATPATASYKQIAPDQLPASAIQTGAGKLVVVIGNDPFNMTMMTANSGGSLGKVNGKPVVFSILSADQPYEQMEKAESYIVRFYPNGQNEPSVILECKKLPSPAAMDGMPRTYVGEILKATIK